MSLMTSLIFAWLAGSSGITCPIPVPTEAEVPWIASPRREDYSWISRFEGCEQLTYADIGSVFLHPDGRLNADLMPDFLHPGAQGYRVFAQALAPHLGTLFGADVVDVGAIE